jgi:hypothetical protein
MAAGLQTWNASGTKTLEVTDKLTRIIHTRTIDPNESSSVWLADFDASKGVAIAVPYSLGNSSGYLPHQVKFYGNTVEWRAGPDQTRCWSYLVVFMYK